MCIRCLYSILSWLWIVYSPYRIYCYSSSWFLLKWELRCSLVIVWFHKGFILHWLCGLVIRSYCLGKWCQPPVITGISEEMDNISAFQSFHWEDYRSVIWNIAVSLSLSLSLTNNLLSPLININKIIVMSENYHLNIYIYIFRHTY